MDVITHCKHFQETEVHLSEAEAALESDLEVGPGGPAADATENSATQGVEMAPGQHAGETDQPAADERLSQRERELAQRERELEEYAIELKRREAALATAQGAPELRQNDARIEPAASSAAATIEEALRTDERPDASTADEEQDVAVHSSERTEVEVEGDEDDGDHRTTISARGTPNCTEPEVCHDSGEEQSIEDYMAGLLNRMRGGKPSDAVMAPQLKRARKKSEPSLEVPQVKTAPAQRDISSGQATDKAMVQADFSRRAQPPETFDMNAMRALANTQARQAIHFHGNKRLLNAVLGRWGLFVACFALTSAAQNLLGDYPGGYTGSMIGVIASIYCLFAAGIATQKLIVTQRDHHRTGDARSSKSAGGRAK